MTHQVSSKPRVLIVDDNDLLRGELAAVLSHFGIEVVGQGSDGVEGIQLAAELNPDVVVLDLRMPKMDGIQAGKIIRQNSPKLPIIILSAYDDEALQNDAKSVGVYCYLIKGCSARLIRDVILKASEHSGETAETSGLGA